MKKFIIMGILLNGVTFLWGYDFFGQSLSTAKTINTAYKFADGMVGINWGNNDEMGNCVAIDGNGKILISGYTATGVTYDFAIARLNADGTLDTTFGASLSTEKTDNTAYQFTPGMIGINWGAGDSSRSIMIDSNEKILIIGSTGSGEGPSTDFAIARLNVDGTLDTTFGADLLTDKTIYTAYQFTPGMIGINCGGTVDSAYSVAIDSDGKILLAGETYNGGDNPTRYFVIVRLLSNGILDTTFGAELGAYDTEIIGAYKFTSGIIGINWGNVLDFVKSIEIDSNGKILVAGYTNNGAGISYDFAIIRFNTDGTLDTAFGASLSTEKEANTAYKFANGMVGINWGIRDDQVASMVLDSTGKILLAGTTNNTAASSSDFAIARLNTDGTLDTTFGSSLGIDNTITGTYKFTSGMVGIHWGDSDTATALTIDSNGKIFISGYTNSGPDIFNYFAIVCLNTDGTLNTSFGSSLGANNAGEGIYKFTNGMIGINFGANTFAFSMAIDTKGRIILTGGTANGGEAQYDFAVARLRSTGVLDSSATFNNAEWNAYYSGLPKGLLKVRA